MEEALFNLIAQQMSNKDKIVIFCIGTDKLIFDSYGPFVGYLLKNVYNLHNKENIIILGDLKNPVHAVNLVQKIEEVDKENSLIIAVDVAITYKKEYHKAIVVEEGPIEPGAAAGKKLPKVGDINIKGLIYGDYIFDTEENVIRIRDIADMAERTAEYINNAVQKYLEIESHILKTARFQKKTVSI
ncbi:spore protease YyaC [Thermoanaerobacter sp. RKWS2]|uniref:spore protease YyaC n=1 Tax=Thermoanaerobacter sp. RKWS2 TaxID=2983842 RepID=UPI00224B73AE|nr:spore protease YyaC [Thermoanaerobacter sp. RKWS2]UZQ81797.1 spore protease YyaC [Thermoanaerobacter sp. RKWS2]